MRLSVFTIVLILVAGIAYGTDIDGKWEGELDMQGQKFPVSYTFKAEGDVLTRIHSHNGTGIQDPGRENRWKQHFLFCCL